MQRKRENFGPLDPPIDDLERLSGPRTSCDSRIRRVAPSPEDAAKLIHSILTIDAAEVARLHESAERINDESARWEAVLGEAKPFPPPATRTIHAAFLTALYNNRGQMETIRSLAARELSNLLPPEQVAEWLGDVAQEQLLDGLLFDLLARKIGHISAAAQFEALAEILERAPVPKRKRGQLRDTCDSLRSLALDHVRFAGILERKPGRPPAARNKRVAPDTLLEDYEHQVAELRAKRARAHVPMGDVEADVRRVMIEDIFQRTGRVVSDLGFQAQLKRRRSARKRSNSGA